MAEKKYKGDLGRVMVIGGNGFLGHHIVDQALASWTTRAVASLDLRCDKNRNPGAEYLECDITDAERLVSLFEQWKPDIVIHTASPVANDPNVAKTLFHKVNVEGTRCVVNACQKTAVKALVYTSSASVVCDNQRDLFNADERWPVLRGDQQPEYYSETKAAAEELVLKANRAEAAPKLLTAAIRPAGIFGEGDAQTLVGFRRAFLSGRDNVQIGDNNNLFDFTYVGNAAHAHMLAARLLLATAVAKTDPLDYERVDGEAFIVTNDAPVYFWDFARAVYRAFGSDKGTSHVWTLSGGVGGFFGMLSEIFANIRGVPPTFSKLRANLSCLTRYYNIGKIKRVLGYEPVWTLKEGLDKSVAWFLEQEKAAEGKTQ